MRLLPGFVGFLSLLCVQVQAIEFPAAYVTTNGYSPVVNYPMANNEFDWYTYFAPDPLVRDNPDPYGTNPGEDLTIPASGNWFIINAVVAVKGAHIFPDKRTYIPPYDFTDEEVPATCQVLLYHRWAYTEEELDEATWTLVGGNDLEGDPDGRYTGGANDALHYGFARRIGYFKGEWNYRYVQWRFVVGHDLNGMNWRDGLPIILSIFDGVPTRRPTRTPILQPRIHQRRLLPLRVLYRPTFPTNQTPTAT